MYNDSRNDIIEYLYGLFHGTVTENVYAISVPTELSKSDTKDGFMVISMGGLLDESEFSREAFGRVRCYAVAYIPLLSRGRYNKAKYKAFEDAINAVIREEIANPTSSVYSIEEDSILSYEDEEQSDADNRYFLYVKSFIVTVDGQ